MNGRPASSAPGLGMAIIGTASIDAFVAFYAGQLGMDASPVAELGGEAFERHWGLPRGSRARAVLMSVGGSEVGRVLGIEFTGRDRRWIADDTRGPFIGYWNLNFYIDGIVDTCARLAAQGYRFWSRPISHEVGKGAGAPIEAIFLGPDRVAINLVQLGGASGSAVAELQQEAARLPRSRKGFSQVATTAHATHDIAAALAFHRDVLGLRPTIDTVLESPAVNELTGRPKDARTRVVWMRGDHPYGKVALSQPLNYALVDRAREAAAPAIGYLAQSFTVPDLAGALAVARSAGAIVLSEPREVELPTDLRVIAALLRSPGSGAPVQLVQA